MYLARKLYGITLFLFLLIQIVIQAQPASHVPKFLPEIDKNINGFWEYLPYNYNVNSNARYPLLIFMHGAGDLGSTQNIATINRVLNAGIPKLIASGNFPDSFLVNGSWQKFIVISPQIKDGIKSALSTIRPTTIDAVIDYAMQTYRVDPNRIYLAGMSMGGGAVWDYLASSRAAGMVTAAIIVAGAADLKSGDANKIADANIPILAVHNLVDNIIFASQTIKNISLINANQPAVRPRTIYFQNGTPTSNHNAWTRTYETLAAGATIGGNVTDTLGINAYQWILQFTRAVQSPVPVTWLSFDVAYVSNEVQLTWKVANQKDVMSYTVQKSKDGTQWNDINTIPLIAGPGPVSYHYTDNTPFSETYYRIKETDLDGKFSFSVIRRVSKPGVPAVSRIYPNPFIDQLTIELANQASSSAVMVSLTDIRGALVRRYKFQVGSQAMTISGLHIPRGMYYLRVETEDGKLLFSQQVQRY